MDWTELANKHRRGDGLPKMIREPSPYDYGGFGLVDDLHLTYAGNMLTSVRDNASRQSYAGATDFDGVTGREYPLTYDDAGSLTSDAGRKIARIEYDCRNNPVRIQFTDGNVTRYVYSAAGEKLRAIYQTAVPNITVAIGSSRELTPSEIQYADSMDYLLGGSLTLKNGRIDRYQFEEGYCRAEKYANNASQDRFTFCYYSRDHLGNIRQVTEADGTHSGKIIQKINYYPFGAEFCDGSTYSSVQPYKYNGKEFDRMHGLNTYDYGARQYNPVTARWDRVDPQAEKYYSTSPYAYCANNPVRFIDPDGKEIIDMLPAQTKKQEIAKQNFFNRWHDNSSSIILMAHGGDNGKSFSTQNYPIHEKIYANIPYGMVFFLEDNSKIWNISSIASDKVQLVMFSCETGSKNGLAENLSKQDDFQKISIFAPSEPVNINPDGSVSINNNGVWREYLNGEVVNEYSGNMLPGTQEFDSSAYWDKTPQNHYWLK